MAVADVHLVSAQDVEMYAPWQAGEAALWSQHMGQRAAMEGRPGPDPRLSSISTLSHLSTRQPSC